MSAAPCVEGAAERRALSICGGDRLHSGIALKRSMKTTPPQTQLARIPLRAVRPKVPAGVGDY
ncbi:MAG TPA: hypothetical protein VF081_07720 [Solirubrobacterales bacterium]